MWKRGPRSLLALWGVSAVPDTGDGAAGGEWEIPGGGERGSRRSEWAPWSGDWGEVAGLLCRRVAVTPRRGGGGPSTPPPPFSPQAPWGWGLGPPPPLQLAAHALGSRHVLEPPPCIQTRGSGPFPPISTPGSHPGSKSKPWSLSHATGPAAQSREPAGIGEGRRGRVKGI